jgi:hypothetical protein
MSSNHTTRSSAKIENSPRKIAEIQEIRKSLGNPEIQRFHLPDDDGLQAVEESL